MATFNRRAALDAGWSPAAVASFTRELELKEKEAKQPKGLRTLKNVGSTIGKTVGGVAKFAFPSTTNLVKGSFSNPEKAKELSKKEWYEYISPGATMLRQDELGAATREIFSYMALKELLPWLTKSKIGGGVAGKATQAAAKATEAGKSTPWNTVTGKITGAVEKKLGKPKEVTTALRTLIEEKTPAQFAEKATMNPTELLDWRRQIQARGGKTFLQRAFQGSNVPEKVESIARSEISKLVHQYAPGTKIPDLLYRLYSGPLGSPIPAALKIGGATLGYSSIYSALRNLMGGNQGNVYGVAGE